MPKYNNKLSNTGKWLETKHKSKGGHYSIDNIDVDVEKFNLNDTSFFSKVRVLDISKISCSCSTYWL